MKIERKGVPAPTETPSVSGWYFGIIHVASMEFDFFKYAFKLGVFRTMYTDYRITNCLFEITM